MDFKKSLLICVSLWLVLMVTAQAENGEIEGVYHDDPVVYTKEGTKLGSLKEVAGISDANKIIGMSIKEVTSRNLVGIEFDNDRILWLRASHLKLSKDKAPVCPDTVTRSPDMTRPNSSGIGCEQK